VSAQSNDEGVVRLKASYVPLRKEGYWGVKNFPKLFLVKLVLVKTGNGERKIYRVIL